MEGRNNMTDEKLSVYPVIPEKEEVISTASEDFKVNITGGKMYIDKTKILIPLLKKIHESTFFLRPRRFGKTLMLSMLRYYLEDTRDDALNAENRLLFDGMYIMSAGDFYTEQMTSYPVIHMTFQSVRGEKFDIAYSALVSVIRDEYKRHSYVLNSEILRPEEKAYFKKILESIVRKEGDPLPVSDLVISLQRLSGFLTAVHGRKTVILIDEYDVPLEKAYIGKYYDKMVNVISPLLQNALKTNSMNLQFAVVTGCLRIAKESIYTGLNNPEINTVLSDSMSDAFGFTCEEVQNLLRVNGFENHYDEIIEWYGGYGFGQSGKTIVCNPWSVIKRIEALKANPNSKPGTPWAGTSENIIIQRLAERGSKYVKENAESLMRGENIKFRERDDIIFAELNYRDENVFNVMLQAGYLTIIDFDGDSITVKIPNFEIKRIFQDKISNWLTGQLAVFDVNELYKALERGDEKGAQDAQIILVTTFLSSMSYYDTLESFYHGVLMTLLKFNEKYHVTSNREAGKGRFDLQCREIGFRRVAIIIEVKVSKKSKDLYSDAEKGAAQTITRNYAVEALQEGFRSVITYGISFYGKDCAICFGNKYSQSDLKRLLSNGSISKKKLYKGTISIGKVITFGRYPYEENNEIKELEWRVLAVKEDKALIITEKLIDCLQYNEFYEEVTWETCSQRKWMNNDFVEVAFNDEERSGIIRVIIKNLDNKRYRIEGGIDTFDSVFALSVDEARMYFKNDKDRITEATAYAKGGGSRKYDSDIPDGEKPDWWWLRSPGSMSNRAASVSVDGGVDEVGKNVFYVMGLVRPALWLSL